MGKKKVTSYDGNLLELLRAGNKHAIKQACNIAMQSFTDTDDEVTAYIHDALKKVAAGVSPDKAFGWRKSVKGATKKSDGFRDWLIALEVQRIHDAGYSKVDAIAAVAGVTESVLGIKFDSVETICKRLAPTLPGIPDDIFPIPDGLLEVMEDLFPVPDYCLPPTGKN